jgi:molybdenum transport protein
MDLLALLREDVPYGDLTTGVLGIGGVQAAISFVARRAMVACCTEEAARLFQLCGAQAWVDAPSGSALSAQAKLLHAVGPAAGLLAAWKVAQNLVEWTSGIATGAARLVAALRKVGLDVPIACTRKAFPGTRWLASKAVVAGGATLHRLGLSESLLVFPEHRLLLSELDGTWLASVRSRERERRLTIEVTRIEQALTFAKAGADALQLERFSPAMVAECRAELQALELHPLLLAAGGVTESNAVDYARAGADVLVSSAPYQSPPADVQVLVRQLRGP